MATLAEVVESIKQQNETLVDIRQVLAASLQEDVAARKVVERSRLDFEEERREAKMVKAPPPTSITAGVMQGLGVTPLQNFINNLLGNVFGGLFSKGGRLAGLLAGAIGLGAGKLIKWGVIGGLIASYFGDEIVNWLDPDGDGIANFGPLEIDLNDPLIVGGLVIAAGAITRALVGFVGGLFVSLGAAGLALVFRRAGLTGLAAILTRAARTASPLPGAGRAGPSTAEAARVAPEVGRAGPSTAEAARVANTTAPSRLTLAEAQTVIRENVNRLPSDVRLTEQGRLLRQTPAGPRFVSPIAVAEEIVNRPPAPVAFSGARPAPVAPTGLPAGTTSTILRGAGYAVAPEIQFVADVAARAAVSQSTAIAGAGRAALGAVSAITSVPAMAIQFAILPSNLADGTRTGYVVEPYNKMVNAMMEGKPINEILGYHKELQTRLDQHPDLRSYEGLGNVASLTEDQIRSATSMLFAKTTGTIYTTRMSQGLGQATIPVARAASARLSDQFGLIKMGQELSALDVMQIERSRSRSNAPVIINAPTDARTTNTSNTGFNIKPRLTAADVQRQAREGLLPRAGR